ncbi:hypothetical protein [Streptomyces sp. NPDC020298]
MSITRSHGAVPPYPPGHHTVPTLRGRHHRAAQGAYADARPARRAVAGE